MSDRSHDNEFCDACGDELQGDEYRFCSEHGDGPEWRGVTAGNVPTNGGTRQPEGDR